MKQSVEFWTLIVTIVSGVATGVWALWVWTKKLRWDQAKLARKMLDEIFDFKPSNDAWRMVDGDTDYKDRDKQSRTITMADVTKALQTTWTEANDATKADESLANDAGVRINNYVRWCFDALFYYLERLEQSIQIRIVRLEDLRAPASYYIKLMAKDKRLFDDYAKGIGFPGAVAFMEHFPEWNEAEPRSAAP